MEDKLIYLDSYILQKDMRIRMPKSILTNIKAEKGTTKFDIYLDQENENIVLKVSKIDEE